MNNLQASAQRHGINLRHGTTNPGAGDCAFESIIQNINDRPCFREKFRMSIDYYRRIFVTDMANRTVDTDFNFLTPQQWREEWKQMLVPGTYERGIFGDLMLPGIACGVRKILLIFNTNPDTPHDPIYVVDPSEFHVSPDTNIPVLLAYNMSHYESMEPLTDIDTQKSIDLVKEYQNGRYRYKKEDLPILLNTDAIMPDDYAYNVNKPNITNDMKGKDRSPTKPQRTNHRGITNNDISEVTTKKKGEKSNKRIGGGRNKQQF